MNKNEIYNSLTEEQLEILEEVTEGKNLEDKESYTEAMSNLLELRREGDFLEPNGIAPEYEEDLGEVERYLKSLREIKTRKKLLLENIDEQKENYNSYDFYKIIHQMGQNYGFTDTEVENIAETVGFVFEENVIDDELEEYELITDVEGEQHLVKMGELEELKPIGEYDYYLVKDITEDELEKKAKEYEDEEEYYDDLYDYLKNKYHYDVVNLYDKELTETDIKDYLEDGYKYLYNVETEYVEELGNFFDTLTECDSFSIYTDGRNEYLVIAKEDVELIQIANQWFMNCNGATSIYYCPEKNKFIVEHVTYLQDCVNTCCWYTIEEFKNEYEYTDDEIRDLIENI